MNSTYVSRMCMKKDSKKNNQKTFTPLSEEVFHQTVEKIFARIDYARKDTGEQIHQVQKSLTSRIDSVGQEVKLTQQALRATKDELTSRMDSMEKKIDVMDTRLSKNIDGIHEVLENHEKRITSLETVHP